MPANPISGPELDKIVAEAKAWYIKEREFLIKSMLSGGYPYGAVPLSPAEQLAKFQQMTQADWDTLRATLLNVFKGDPQVTDKADKTIAAYTQNMRNYASIIRSGNTLNSGPGSVPIA